MLTWLLGNIAVTLSIALIVGYGAANAAINRKDNERCLACEDK